MDKRKDERKREKEYQCYRIPTCKVYESSPKRQCNKASILIDSSIMKYEMNSRYRRKKSFESIKTKKVDSRINWIISSIVEFGPNH